MALRFLSNSGGTTSDAVRVFDYARTNGAQVINASWGGRGYSESLLQAIARCYEKDILIVAAAGNNHSDNDKIPHYPASFKLPNVISVAATDGTDNLTYFSNYGKNSVDLTAPGADIWSCGARSDSDYKYLSGTSMAAPHVTGAIALAKAQFPLDDADELVRRLISSSDPFSHLIEKVASRGRLNLQKLLSSANGALLHDDFDNPLVLDNYGTWWGWDTDATREVDEDGFSPNTGTRSLWYSWTAPEDGLLTFFGDAGESNLDVLDGIPGNTISIVAFEGDNRHTLRRIGDNFDCPDGEFSFIRFYVEKGKTYRFCSDSHSPTKQFIHVSLGLAPANDFISNATSLSGETFQVKGFNTEATAENFEKNSPHAGVGVGMSVWWKWTAEFDGEFIFNTRANNRETGIDTVLAVYKGTPSSLVLVAANDDRNELDWTSQVKISVTSGQTYYIAVDSYDSFISGAFFLNGFKSEGIVILDSPQETVAKVGDSVDFPVIALGANSLEYIWKKDGFPLAWPHSNNILYMRPVGINSYGMYSVDVTDGESTVSRQWELKPPEIAPYITRNLNDRIIADGSTLNLDPSVAGTLPITYQWYKNSNPISGQTNRELNIANTGAADSGKYYLSATNTYGVTSTYEVSITVQGSGTLKWVKRFPNQQSLDYIEGVSWNGNLHLLTSQGLWVKGKDVNSLVAEPILGFRVLNGIRVHDSKLVIFGRDVEKYWEAQNNLLMVSDDGVSFSKIATNWPSSEILTDFESNDTTAVALVNGQILYSSDLVTWESASGITKSAYEGLEYSGGRFLAARTTLYGSGEDALQWAVSIDGVHWTEYSEDYGYNGRESSSLSSANGYFFIKGYDGVVSVTSDGITWKHGVTGFSGVPLFDGTSYYTSLLASSSDALTWDQSKSPLFSSGLPHASDFLMHQNQYVSMGAGFISQSPNVYEQKRLNASTQLRESRELNNVGNRLNASFRGRVIGSPFTVDGIHWQYKHFIDRATAKEIAPFRASVSENMIWLIGGRLYPDQNLIYKGSATSTTLEKVARPPGADHTTNFTAVAASGDVVVLADATRLWISRDNGESWKISTDVTGVSYYGHLYATPSGFLIVDGDKAWVSLDHGVVWQEKSIAILGRRGSNFIAKVNQLGASVVALSEDAYLLRSENSGQTWETQDLGESGWASAVHYNGKIYILHTDGRLGVSENGSPFVFDSFFTQFQEAKDIEPFNGALFVLVKNKKAMVFQAGALESEAIKLKISGISNESIHDIGQKFHLNWDSSIQDGSLSNVTVFINGVPITSRASLQGDITFTLPGEGRYVVEVTGTASNGVSLTEKRVLYSRGVPMKMIVRRRAKINCLT